MEGATIEIERHDEQEHAFDTPHALESPEFGERARSLEQMLRKCFGKFGIAHKILVNPGPGERYQPCPENRGWYTARQKPHGKVRYPRLGAFEVMLKWPPVSTSGAGIGMRKQLVIWSRLKTKDWPDDIEQFASGAVCLFLEGCDGLNEAVKAKALAKLQEAARPASPSAASHRAWPPGIVEPQAAPLCPDIRQAPSGAAGSTSLERSSSAPMLALAATRHPGLPPSPLNGEGSPARSSAARGALSSSTIFRSTSEPRATKPKINRKRLGAAGEAQMSSSGLRSPSASCWSPRPLPTDGCPLGSPIASQTGLAATTAAGSARCWSCRFTMTPCTRCACNCGLKTREPAWSVAVGGTWARQVAAVGKCPSHVFWSVPAVPGNRPG